MVIMNKIDNNKTTTTPGTVIKQRTPQQQRLKNWEMREQTKAFAIMLEIIAIFAVPAILVAVLYNWVGFERWILYAALFFAFVLSWAITLRRVRQMKERLDKIRAEREKIEDIDMTPIVDDEEER
jgi:F0F1-type ATP synthase assembly protein I